MKLKFNLLFLLLLLIASLLTILLGDISLQEIWAQRQNSWNPILDERLPRLIVLICTGASLAVAGAVLQSLFQNPLASPSILGVSSGGSLAVVIIFILQLHLIHPLILPFSAVMGSLLVLGLVYVITLLQGGAPLNNLILTGVALSTLLIACQSFLLYAFRDHWQLIQTVTEWESSSTIDRTWRHVHMQLPLTIVGLTGCLAYRRELNVLTLGEEEAKNLGVDVEKIRWRLFLCIALLVGGSLAALGMIAFFGLILPHIARRLQGTNHCNLIPFCILAGASILTSLDLILRFFNLTDLSLGNLSAIGGGIFFIFLLLQSQRRDRVQV